jgi:hypothetical protein
LIKFHFFIFELLSLMFEYNVSLIESTISLKMIEVSITCIQRSSLRIKRIYLSLNVLIFNIYQVILLKIALRAWRCTYEIILCIISSKMFLCKNMKHFIALNSGSFHFFNNKFICAYTFILAIYIPFFILLSRRNWLISLQYSYI